jgi:hypothetical protein
MLRILQFVKQVTLVEWVPIYQATQHHISEDSNLHHHENLNSHKYVWLQNMCKELIKPVTPPAFHGAQSKNLQA